MGFRSFVIHVANDLQLNQMELVQLPGMQVRSRQVMSFYGRLEITNGEVARPTPHNL